MDLLRFRYIATVAIRRGIMGAPITSSEALRQLQHSLEVCESLIENYITIPVSLGLRMGPELWSPRWVESSMMEPSTPKKR